MDLMGTRVAWLLQLVLVTNVTRFVLLDETVSLCISLA